MNAVLYAGVRRLVIAMAVALVIVIVVVEVVVVVRLGVAVVVGGGVAAERVFCREAADESSPHAGKV